MFSSDSFYELEEGSHIEKVVYGIFKVTLDGKVDLLHLLPLGRTKWEAVNYIYNKNLRNVIVLEVYNYEGNK